MPKLINKRSKKAGLPPGSLIFIGEKRTEKPKITLFDYNESHLEEKEIINIEECFLFKEKPSVTWINIDGLHEVEILEKLGRHFGLHSLVMEDILNTDQRPKSEDFTNYIYIVLKMLSYDEKAKEVVIEQVSLILSSNFVLSLQEGIEGDVFNPIRERLRTDKGRIRKMGTDYLLYVLLDTIIDNYFLILEKLGEKIELAEEELIKRPTSKTLYEVQRLKKEMILLRKSVWPLREVINGLERGESSLIKEQIKIYFRDIYDHTIQVMDTIESFRDLLSGMIDIYLSSVSNRMNEVIRTLTIIATIFMPPTFIVGIYGMNFKHMPELDWYWGYPAIMLLMLLVCISMLAYFKKKRWI